MIFKREARCLAALAVLLTCVCNLYAQSTDTLRLNLNQAEQVFLKQNFSLLAQKYNIQAQEALVIQAKLFPNPNFQIGHTLYNPEKKILFPTGDNGEISAQISQLIQLAGKRNKSIKIAEANTRLSQYQFFDLLRTLKYSLRSTFFNVYFLMQSARVYNEEINSLEQVVKAFDEESGKGYIAEKEVIRVKAQLYSLHNEYNGLINQINDLQSQLRIILQVKKVSIIPEINLSEITSLKPDKYPLSTLLDSAAVNRTDLQIAKENVHIGKLNLSYQKALSVPDITTSVSYDQQGSYVHNLSMVGISFDLPFFNRNQGNIKSAKYMTEMAKTTQEATQAAVNETIFRAYQKANDFNKLYVKIDPEFSKRFNYLQKEVLINYRKRNIGLLDFLDFYDSYKQNILQQNQIEYNRVQAFEDINFYTGTNFFNKQDIK